VKSWVERFKEFFADQALDFHRLRNAAGCRESWIQGQAYLHFNPEESVKTDSAIRMPFLVNGYSPTGEKGGATFDFAWFDRAKSERPEMVAEFKMLGTKGYQLKAVADLPRYRLEEIRQREGGLILTEKDEHESLRWCVFKDYLRLLKCPQHRLAPDAERLLILLLDLSKGPDPKIGHLFEMAEFGYVTPHVEKLCGDSLLLKIWRVGGGDQ
jgi:hypothetical protein